MSGSYVLSGRHCLNGQQEKSPRATKIIVWESKRNTVRRLKEMLVKSKVSLETLQGARSRDRINARRQECPGGNL